MATRRTISFDKTMKRLNIEKDGNYLKVGNKWYQFVTNEDENFATGEYVLEEVNKEKIDKQIQFLTSKLFSFVNPKLILVDALKDLDDKQLGRIYNKILKSKAKVKTIKHCVALKIGNDKIWLRE